MSYRQFAVLVLCSLSLASCYIKGLTNGYKRLIDSEKELIVFKSQSCPAANTDSIYLFNGLEFKKCLKEYRKAVLYRWDPNCSSKNCISLPTCELYCNKNGYELFVLLEYLDLPKQKQLPKSSKSIIMSDFKYYRSNNSDKCSGKFIEDLISKSVKDTSIQYKRFLFFEEGQFVYAKEKLFEASFFYK